MIWLAGVAAVCLLLCLPLFMYYKKRLQYMLAALYKTSGTLCAMIPALVAALRLDPKYWICAGAIMIHAVADFLLESNLYLGAGFFLIGHIGYVALFLQLYPIGAVHLICLLGFLAFTAVVFWRWRDQIGKRFPLMAVYGAVLCVMCASALGALSGGTTQGIMIGCGGALFYISDFIICRRLLFPAGRSADWAIMILYYMAQLLFGMSCLLPSV